MKQGIHDVQTNAIVGRHIAESVTTEEKQRPNWLI